RQSIGKSDGAGLCLLDSFAAKLLGRGPIIGLRADGGRAARRAADDPDPKSARQEPRPPIDVPLTHFGFIPTNTAMVPSAQSMIEAFDAAAEENRLSPLRHEQAVDLPEGPGELWMTGDLHDHRRNFEKLIRAADLANHPQRNLILHEIIHG